MTSEKFQNKLKEIVEKNKNLSFKSYPLKYAQGKFSFPVIYSKSIFKKDKVFLLCAGVHGEEIAGPLTFYRHLNKISSLIHKAGFKLIIYPLRNPSGFEKKLRYNIDNDKGEGGNNDLMRYELKNGTIIDDLKDKNNTEAADWSSNQKLKIKLPKETKLLQRLLQNDFKKFNIVACLDLHQDFITPNSKAAAYHYGFGETAMYKNIVKEIQKIVTIWKNRYIGAGFNAIVTNKGVVKKRVPKEELIKSDNLGFIERFDGTLGDLTQRLGVKYSITVETTGSTPLPHAIQVNLIWIKGLLNLITD